MAQARTTLKVSPRDIFGSRATRRLRKDGLVPGVVYGQGGEARPFQVPERDLRNVLQEGQTPLDLEVDGSKPVPVVIKEQQHHPVRGEDTHVDGVEGRLDEEIQAEVTIELEGTENAPGVREGGVLEHVTREITVEALPTAIPEQIVVDVSAMEINDTISLATVTVPGGVKFMADDPEEITIATLSPPRVEEEPEPGLEEGREPAQEEHAWPAEKSEKAPEGEEGAEGEREGEGEAAEGEGGGDESGGEEPLSLFRRGSRSSHDRDPRADALIVGLGNPGNQYAATRHNLGFEVASELSRRWELPRARERFRGMLAEGRAGVGGPRVAILLPQTFMNESG